MNKYWFLAGVLLSLSACDSLPSWMGDDEDEAVLPGDRVSVLEYKRSIEPDEALADVKVELLPSETNTDWKFETAIQSSGYENLTVEGFDNKQSVTVGNGSNWETVLVPQPVIGDGKLFAMDASGHVSAHDVTDVGKVVWVSDLPVAEDEEDIGGGGLAYDDGVIYLTTGRGLLMALKAEDGSLFWQQRLDVPIRSAPVVEDGRLFAVTIDNQLIAHESTTGRSLWTHRGIKESALYLGGISPSVTNGIVIVGYTSGELYALRAEDGSPIWSETLIVPRRTVASAGLTGINATPLVRDNTVYALSNSGLMVANMLTNGRGVWDLELSGYLTPWIAGDYIYLVTSDHQLLSVQRKDGAVKWAVSLKREDDGKDVTPRLNGPIVLNGKVAMLTDEGELTFYAVQDGSTGETISIADGVAAPPVVANGRLYLLTRDATLHVYQ